MSQCQHLICCNSSFIITHVFGCFIDLAQKCPKPNRTKQNQAKVGKVQHQRHIIKAEPEKDKQKSASQTQDDRKMTKWKEQIKSMQNG